jgi:uncharacterized protein (DUF2141 family)
MRRITRSILMLLAAAAVMAVAATSASAALTEFTTETSAKSPEQTVTSTFETPESFEGKIKSTKLKSEQKATSKKLGTITITFLGVKCEKLGVSVSGHSLGDAAGTVLVTGEYHVVNEGEILLLISPVHIECESPFGVELIVVSGDVAGKISPTKSKTSSFKLEVKGEKGKQTLDPTFENDSAEKVSTKLTTETNEKNPEPSSQNESAAVSIETSEPTELT